MACCCNEFVYLIRKEAGRPLDEWMGIQYTHAGCMMAHQLQWLQGIRLSYEYERPLDGMFSDKSGGRVRSGYDGVPFSLLLLLLLFFKIPTREHNSVHHAADVAFYLARIAVIIIEKMSCKAALCDEKIKKTWGMVARFLHTDFSISPL